MTNAFDDNGLPDNRIAIIGRAGRFPAARNVAEYWDMLHAGRRAAVRLSEGELLAAGVSRKMLADPAYVREAGILPDMEAFDAGFFGFSPREASILDPQHRHFLETAWEALEDAGHMPENFDGRVGVYAGSGMQAYLPFNLLSNPALVEEIGLFLLRHTGNDKDFMPTRLSYLLNLTGPSVAVQTACSTSLVAVHMAVNSLLNMECEMAIAGGVTIELPHRVGYRFAEGEILSPDGLCRAFDDASQGTVFGSGAAVVVLRRYADAVADGDDIKAVILGTAINNDGAGKASYLAPSVDGQAEAAAEAVAMAGVAPQSISYIEAHGTGTPIGDPIELAALSQVYGKAAKGSIGIGSVKTNIGHLDTAAGAASLIKVVEAMRHRHLPASLNFKTPNSRFDFSASPFQVVAQGRDWPEGANPRRAAVNSLGVGGTNAHVIVEEAPARAETQSTDGWRVFPFSARDAAALARTADKWALSLSAYSADPADIAFTLRNGRRAFPERMAVAARGVGDLASALAAKASPFVQKGRATATPPGIVFLFPGGGAQYPGAGAGMLAQSPAFAAAVKDCFDGLPKDAPADLYAMMFERTLEDTEARAKLGRSGYAIPALFILEYAYARHWESWGIRPDAILAHSVGEYAGAVTAGAMALKDALRIVTLRGRVMDAAPAGAMTTVPQGAAAVEKLLGDHLDIAAINMAEATVVSGPLAEIEALEARLADTDHAARRIHIDVAAHSRQLDGQLEAFRAGFEGVRFGKLGVPMVSSLRGGWATGDDIVSADYWVRHLRHTVRFTDAMAASFDTGNRIVIEVGPGQTMGPLVEMASLTHRPVAILPSAPRPRDGQDDMGVISAAFGGLWANGVAVDWDRLHGAEGRRVSLPTYAFEKTRHWIAPGRGHAYAAEPDESAEPLVLTRRPDLADWFETETWEARPLSGAEASWSGSWLVFAGDDAFSTAVLTELSAVAGADVHLVRPGAGFSVDGQQHTSTIRPAVAEDYATLIDGWGEELPKRILNLWALEAIPDAFGDAFLLAQALQRADVGAGRRLVFATRGTAAAAGLDVTNPDGAALLGPVRIAPRETDGLSASLVDLPPGADAAVARALLAEVASFDSADRVAIRAEGRFVEHRIALPTGELQPGLHSRLRTGGVYLITGGTGGIGGLMAEWLARRCSARVILVSRSGRAEPQREQAIRDAGGEVMVLAADVTDPASLERALALVRDRWGAIDGVIHAAGTIADAPLMAKTLADTAAVLAPKIEGGRNLSALFPAGSLDFFAVLSSSSVTIAPAGQTDYVAANAWLEALAASRPDGLSIRSGVWRDIGMAERSYGPGKALPGGPHPLLGPVEAGPDGSLRFLRRLDPARDWVLAEHVVGGQSVLPGSAYVEIARAAAAVARPGASIEIRALSLGAPMLFSDGGARRMTVSLIPASDGYDLTVESLGLAGSQPEEHARAQITYPDNPPSCAPDALATQRTGIAEVPSSGRPPQDQFIVFGPRWHSTGIVRHADGWTEGHFRLPEQFRDDLAEGYELHPALLDMAMTVGLHGLAPEDHAGLVYAPVSLGRISILAPLGAEVTARAVQMRRDPRRLLTFDVAILGADGQPCVLIEGLALRAIKSGALGQGRDQTNITQSLLAGGLRPEDAPEVFDRVFSSGATLVLVSPVSLDHVRLAMARGTAEERPDRVEKASGGGTSNPVEAKLASIWSELLGVPSIGSTDDFFALGGHSLNAVRMFGRIRREFGVDLPLASLFEGPTLAAVAERIAAAAGVKLSAADAPPSAMPLDAAQLPPAPRKIPLTEGQREIYTGLLIEPELSRGHNLCFSLTLEGPVDADLMSSALNAVVARHDALHAGFDPTDLTMDINPDARLNLNHVDLVGLSDVEQAERRQVVQKDLATPAFDLAAPPLMRATLIRFAEDRHELLIAVHHIVCDGWSIGVVLQDLGEIYSASVEARAPRLPVAQSVAELVAAEQLFAASPDAARHRDYWTAQYATSVPAMDLPTDHPRPNKRTTRANRVDQKLTPDLEAALRAAAARLGTALPTFILAAFQTYLSRLIGSEDVVIGLPSSGQISHALERVVGHGVNFLPLRSHVSHAMRFDAFVAQVQSGLLSALDHQNYTYGTLMRDLNLPRDPSRLTLVPVVVNFDNLADLGEVHFGNTKATLEVLPSGHEHFELFLNVLDTPGRVRLSWNHNLDLFDASTIASHAALFGRLLEGLAKDPAIHISDIGRLMVETFHPASGTHDDPGVLGEQVVTEVLRRVARQYPDRIALSYLGTEMDYATLDARSDALAAELAELGVRQGDLVGITSERSLGLIVAVLGTLKAGAGYVPFDTALPAERLRFLAQDTGIRVLIGDCEPVASTGVHEISFLRLPHTLAPGVTVPTPALTGEDICYVMFTSGTTGVPKGVVLPHRSVVRLLVDTDWLQLGPETVTLHSSTFAFDTSIIDIFAPLLHGGRLVIPKDGALSISDLAEAIASGGVNTLWLTSGLFHAIADLWPSVFRSVAQVIVGGDIVSPGHVAKVMETCPEVAVINGYGPTESNVTNAHRITWEDIRSGQSLPIGRAVPGTQIYIIDEAGTPVPRGMMGELAIAGRGLALGYWNRPELTAEKFFTASWDPSLRLYRSGDLAMDPGDGVIRFFGRIDTQVKVRGFRVELSEVEAAVESHPGVQQACVVAMVPEGQTEKVLASYVVPRGLAPTRRSLAEHVKERLPAFARPTHYVTMSTLPLNPNGKVDRRALPPITADGREPGDSRPETQTEEVLAQIWGEILGLKNVGVEADFFDLGGHSLLALKLFTRIRQQFDLDMPISTLFQNPTVRDLAQVLDTRLGQVALPALAAPAAQPHGATAPGIEDAEWDTTTIISAGPGSGRRPIFVVGGVGGNVNNLYHLGGLIGQARPVIGFQTRGILGHRPHDRIETMATENIRYMRQRQAKGPYLIAGYSGGALTAFEMARQLVAEGEEVRHIFVLDTYAPGFAANFSPKVNLGLKARLADELDWLREQPLGEQIERLRLIARKRLVRGPILAALKRLDPTFYRIETTRRLWLAAAARYTGGPLDCQMTLFRSEPGNRRQRAVTESAPLLGWDKMIPLAKISVVHLPGDHNSMLLSRGAEIIAEKIESRATG